jgi:nascent polypeptide-associated complex subunit alpha
MFVIADADVFKSPSSNTYVIFGEAKIEDLKQKEMAAQQNMQRQERYNSQAAANQYTAANKATAQTSASDEVVDETGVDPKDIELVVSQANCSRGDAVRALKKNDNDIVNAIMELTI